VVEVGGGVWEEVVIGLHNTCEAGGGGGGKKVEENSMDKPS
jgi:hypothetical protein